MNNNPLNMSLNDIDTSRPILEAGTYDLTIEKAEIGETSGNDGKPKVPMLKLECKTNDSARSTKGDDLQPGIKLFTNTVLAPIGKMDWAGVGKNVGGLVQSAQLDMNQYGSTGMDQINAYAQWAPALQGRTVRATVTVSNDQRGEPRNEISRFVKR